MDARTSSREEPCRRCWRHRSFAKDTAKLWVRERYRRRAELELLPEYGVAAAATPLPRRRLAVVVPDASTWRKYLRLIQKLVAVQSEQKQTTTAAAALENAATATTRWVLLESAAELLEYRNQSPAVTVVFDDDDPDDSIGRLRPPRGRTTAKQEEKASSHERSALNRLVERYRHGTVVSVDAFCDLSVRERSDGDGGSAIDFAGGDEWDWLRYEELSTERRCRHALIRAGRILLELQRHNARQVAASTASSAAPIAEVLLVVSDDEHYKEIVEQYRLEEGIRVVRIDELIADIVIPTGGGDGTGKSVLQQQLLELRRSCDEEYDKNNCCRRAAEAAAAAAGGEDAEPTAEQIRDGLRNRTLLRGRFEVSKDNPKEAFVSAAASPTIVVDGKDPNKRIHYFVDKQRGHFNRAFHQDVVIIRVLPKDQWGRPVGRRRLVHHKDDADEDEDHNLLDTLDVPSVPSARVVAISEPARRTFVATMLDRPKDGDAYILAVPMDTRIPKIRVHARLWTNYEGKRLKIHVDEWEAGSNYPRGRCVGIFGPIGDLETELAALLHENQIELDPFSAAALSCLPIEGADWSIPKEELKHRRDLRTGRQIFSVDPPGCQDIDDSMHAFELPNGDIEVGVHIADVTHFVKHGSPLDLEAQVRGTTFYLVDRRFDMLPSLLSSNLCSLHGGTDRLAVSVIWTFSFDLEEIKDCWYGRTIIHNCAGKKKMNWSVWYTKNTAPSH